MWSATAQDAQGNTYSTNNYDYGDSFLFWNVSSTIVVKKLVLTATVPGATTFRLFPSDYTNDAIRKKPFSR
jgi:hypothetical protein